MTGSPTVPLMSWTEQSKTTVVKEIKKTYRAMLGGNTSQSEPSDDDSDVEEEWKMATQQAKATVAQPRTHTAAPTGCQIKAELEKFFNQTIEWAQVFTD